MPDQIFRFTLTLEIDAPSREEAEDTAQKLVKLSPTMAQSLNGYAYRFVAVDRVKPTPEQAAAARLSVEALLVHIEATYPADDPRTANHAAALRTLLAATEPPTDEELESEPAAYYTHTTDQTIDDIQATRAARESYRAGMLRMGRRYRA